VENGISLTYFLPHNVTMCTRGSCPRRTQGPAWFKTDGVEFQVRNALLMASTFAHCGVVQWKMQ